LIHVKRREAPDAKISLMKPTDDPTHGAGTGCKTRAIGDIPLFAECLAENPVGCIHALNFGNSFLCYHSKRRDFERSTDAATRPASDEQDGGGVLPLT
jgi:hypothetical protein